MDPGGEVAKNQRKPGVVAINDGAGRIPGNDGSIMDKEKVAETLFAQFGFEEFQTHRIPPEVMQRLAELMEIDPSYQYLNTVVGVRISQLEGIPYTLESGRKVTLTVTRPKSRYKRRRFQWT